jgi:alkylation response protein AidB-like acyl-CoA dehydrogenase
MDFNLTEDQLAIQKLAAEFNKREIEPEAAKIERDGRLPDDLIKRYAQNGFLGLTLPKIYGGAEAGNLACTLAIEQLAYSGCGAWWVVGFNNSIPESIAHFGSDKIKDKYLRAFTDGTGYASIQFTEAETGSDPSALTTTSVIDGDSYVINGEKRFSTFGARPGYSVTYTKDENGKCTAFVIEKSGLGYSAPRVVELMGGGGIEASDVYFENFRVPQENVLGEPGKGLDILLFWISTEKVQQCAASVGIAQAALDEAIKYVKTRMSRGKPISSMQGIRWMLAEMQGKLEACRWLAYKTAFSQDQALGLAKTGSQHEPAHKLLASWQTEAAATKLFVVPTATEIVEMSRRLHGAYGYTKELKIERLYRSIAGFSVIATSLEINKSIVGGELVK